jgi:hypothetical protein
MPIDRNGGQYITANPQQPTQLRRRLPIERLGLGAVGLNFQHFQQPVDCFLPEWA